MMHQEKSDRPVFPKRHGQEINSPRCRLITFPQSGWISCYIGEHGVAGATELFRMQYERMTGYGKKATAVP